MAGKAGGGRGKKTLSAGAKAPKLTGRGKKQRLALVRWMIAKWTEHMEKDATKPGVSELIRLLALEKELSGPQELVKEIKVTWVDSTQTESSKSE